MRKPSRQVDTYNNQLWYEQTIKDLQYQNEAVTAHVNITDGNPHGTDWNMLEGTVNYLPMDVAPTSIPTTEGTLSWNETDHTLNIQSEIADSILQVGQEFWLRGVNKTGVEITDGQCVYVSGAQGNRPTISLAKGDAEATSYVIGVATAHIAANAEGYVTVLGRVGGYNTSGFTTGDFLYISTTTAGALTNTRPSAPNHAVKVAIALNSTNNGSIYVNPEVGYELGELHDVLIGTKTYGDLLTWDDTIKVWKNGRIVGDGTNYTEFENNGTVHFVGAATVYDDLPPIPMINLRFGGANNPSLATLVGNIFAMRFAVGDYLYGNYEIVHEYKEGTNLDVHVHWVTNGTHTNDRYVKWEIEWTIANLNYEMTSAATSDQIFSSSTVASFEQVILANTPDRTHIYTDISDIIVPATKIGAYILYRIRRIAATGTAPTSDPFGLALGIHIEKDTCGSRTEITK